MAAKGVRVEERHLSLSEVADALDISERTAYRWIKSGKLRAYKPGRDYRIPESAVSELVQESEVRPKAPAPSPEPSFNDVLEEERRANWRSAVDEARRLREGGRARMEELLAAWQASREREELRSARRGHLGEIEELLNNAYSAQAPLVNLFFAGLMQRAAGEWEADWEEVLASERFYWTLIDMMKDAGFVITEHKSEPPEVKEPAA
jgi:excisionase family DNA binding protein